MAPVRAQTFLIYLHLLWLLKSSLLLRLREKVNLSQFHPEIQEEVVGDNQVDAGVQGERLGGPAGVHTVP